MLQEKCLYDLKYSQDQDLSLMYEEILQESCSCISIDTFKCFQLRHPKFKASLSTIKIINKKKKDVSRNLSYNVKEWLWFTNLTFKYYV